jgi:type IV secretory system conjugative DNA transfer VirD4/TraG family protein
MLAFQRSCDVFDVARAIETRNFDPWLDAPGRGEAGDVLEAFLTHEHRTIDGVLTTAETMLMPWRFRQPLANVRSVVAGANTLYLCGPRGEQRHYEPLFRGALRMILEEQQRLVELGSHRRLLLVLDEAATVASLDELDQMASTVSGLDVTLVTVLQDFSQLKARWGPRASTIVNNHTTRLVLGGLADPTASQFLPELFETPKDAPPAVPLRQRPPGTGTVIAGHRPAYPVRLQPWWSDRRLRVRGVRER